MRLRFFSSFKTILNGNTMKGGLYFWQKPPGTIKKNELTQAEQDSIERQQREELDFPNLTVKDATITNSRRKKDIEEDINTLQSRYSNRFYETSNEPLAVFQQRKIDEIAKLDGKAIKGLIDGITTYNFIQRQGDKANPFLTRRLKSKYPCGTITCKQRGLKIQKALKELLYEYPPEVLGEIGLTTRRKSYVDYLTPFKSRTEKDYKQQQYKCRYNGPDDLLAVVEIADEIKVSRNETLSKLLEIIDYSYAEGDDNEYLNDIITPNRECWSQLVKSVMVAYPKSRIQDLIPVTKVANKNCVFENELDAPKVINSLYDNFEEVKLQDNVKISRLNANNPCFQNLKTDLLNLYPNITIGELRGMLVKKGVAPKKIVPIKTKSILDYTQWEPFGGKRKRTRRK
jgi:hypothetical protein